jgi:hypothetical protein
LLPNKQQEGEIKMKKEIIALIIAIATVLGCCGFTSVASAGNTETVVEYVEKVVEVEVDNSFCVERIDEFTDENLSTYTMAQLQILIEDARARQIAAHELAESARKLGWPEESEPIDSAKAEW